jgi:hypothetical protein
MEEYVYDGSTRIAGFVKMCRLETHRETAEE